MERLKTQRMQNGAMCIQILQQNSAQKGAKSALRLKLQAFWVVCKWKL